MADLQPLEQILGVTFQNTDTLRQALVHRSYLNEHPDFMLGHNERLEFLGDAVLELVVTEYLYLHYENPEGELTNWRAALVNADTLADICESLGVEAYLYLSKGEAKDKNSKARHYILANAFEAVIGAIYLDQGWESSKKFITDTVLIELPKILQHQLYLDPKSRFQESAQEKHGVTPIYKVLSEEGPDHAKVFQVGVYLGKDLVTVGIGTSKHEAQVAAAATAITKMGW
ncbi:MAG: Ribonuclease 3 [Candidatus Uhrbacteria bacterium GW2011_GWF2_41_16]|uniref:Ribonuclease 3 n=2 Tax=Candidatus Uhriibacteriota TaxID=1752732 RepID=A0A0G0VGC1_9BACT|nr:MAG: Ribonuclease 3 [Candidatus Uhrbacteria bacterium GW2011_GWA2_41_10]KKR87742.1 MAG: Ribonuclease 3 [Candidatus Uhrbacteria bacterium GW2011_GWC2_41_11]KKR98681.1 MAG: Ribonuclease 3 [Candidatus Uhrbacteria bacterium GW2011_GWF2_41_16]HBO99610.1 ribonuclease III [Candidatus Uhrbacteria bacterium]